MIIFKNFIGDTILKYKDGSSFDITDLKHPVNLTFQSKSRRRIQNDVEIYLAKKLPKYTIIGNLSDFIFVSKVNKHYCIVDTAISFDSITLEDTIVYHEELDEMLSSKDFRNKYPYVIDDLKRIYKFYIEESKCFKEITSEF